MAYEARSHFPEKTIHLTNAIIHNPQVFFYYYYYYYYYFLFFFFFLCFKKLQCNYYD
jgi:hypothetical protein